MVDPVTHGAGGAAPARSSPWTGGQYSLYRASLGAYLVVHFAMLLPYGTEVFAHGGTVADGSLSPFFGSLPNPLQLNDGPFAVASLLVLGLLCGVAVAIGWCDRVGAVLAALVLGWLFQRNPLIANPSLPLLGWLLVLHAFVPARPYGSLAGVRNGADPDWRLPRHLWVAAWVVLALAYTHSGWTKLASPSWVAGDTIRLVLENPLARDHVLREWLLATPPIVLQVLTWLVLGVELLFAPAVLSNGLRPWMWGTMLLAQLGFLVFLDFADLTFPMLLAHLLTFDPRWLAGHERKTGAIVFFDGSCAFCHATARLAMHEDAHARLQFAPLDGATARNVLGERLPATAGESVIVFDENGDVARKSRAVTEVLLRLGGLWLALGCALQLLPRRVADSAYDMVGRIRYRLAGKTDMSACALLPPRLAQRVLE
jgi:predicted DCC family thiol-disulfide oxidoreductase YuxK